MKYIIVLLMLFIISCQTTAKWVNGEKKNEKENYESLTVFITENSLPITLENCLFLKDKNDFMDAALYKEYNKYRNGDISLPDVYLFNENSILINDEALGGCIINRPTFENNSFYAEILKKNEVVGNGFQLNKLKGHLYNYKGDSIFPFSKDKPCLIVLWSKYKGKKWMKTFLPYTQKTLIGTEDKLDVYYLNMDEYTYLTQF